MDRAGFLDKVIASATNIYEGRLGLDTDGGEREGRINYQSGLALGIEAFREIQTQAAEDLYMVILAEYTFLIQELEFCVSQDTKARVSLSKAIQEFDDAFFALEVLQNAEIYRVLDKVFPHRSEFRYREMPKDSFHAASGGHRARLDNILKAPRYQPFGKRIIETAVCKYSNGAVGVSGKAKENSLEITHEPNEATIAAMEEGDAMERGEIPANRYNSVDEVWKKLGL